ncbi:unnamed protein product [Ostreobium quekettii]|uniref:Peptidase S1 domain-containing protein n=1 Tax=Ostreobium quekettii TaxID=121088 RepID=A0A8S1J571_9CHLO|nr:unnamed protein product [Ostreobium quekettii]|eukprot:evm.model.scf_782.1 EVM.evm.TU.scf_782.1   scf_782:32728-38737(+)
MWTGLTRWGLIRWGLSAFAVWLLCRVVCHSGWIEASLEGQVDPWECGEFPYVVSVLRQRPQFRHGCDAVVVNKRWVITSAHCLEDLRDSGDSDANPIILFGACYGRPAEVMRTDYTAVHPDYTGRYTQSNDIALMRLEKDAPDMPGVLPSRDFTTDVSSHKWPTLELTWQGFIDSMYYTTISASQSRLYNASGDGKLARLGSAVAIVDSSDCHSVSGEICVKINKTCVGNGGGVLVLRANSIGRHNDLVVGLAAFPNDAEGCVNASQPRAFTKLWEQLDWMRDTTQGLLEPDKKEMAAKLDTAVYAGDSEGVRAALSAGADIVARPFGSVFNGAVAGGNLDICGLLLDAGADPSESFFFIQNPDRDWPLNTAVFDGNAAMVELLLGAGAGGKGFDRCVPSRFGPYNIGFEACSKSYPSHYGKTERPKDKIEAYGKIAAALMEAGACGGCREKQGPACFGASGFNEDC